MDPPVTFEFHSLTSIRDRYLPGMSLSDVLETYYFQSRNMMSIKSLLSEDSHGTIFLEQMRSWGQTDLEHLLEWRSECFLSGNPKNPNLLRT